MQFQHITVKPIKQILHTVDNNILQNLPIIQEDADMAEDIYGPSVAIFARQNGPAQYSACGTCYVTKCPQGHP